jgi:hypothetical protein
VKVFNCQDYLIALHSSDVGLRSVIGVQEMEASPFALLLSEKCAFTALDFHADSNTLLAVSSLGGVYRLSL